jgi:tetratricopeptide (TPR) repeat protein
MPGCGFTVGVGSTGWCKKEETMKTLRRFGLVIVSALTLAGASGPQWVYSAHAAPPPQDVDCDALHQEGDDLYYQARYQEALDKFHDALACYRKDSDREGEAITLNDIGHIYHGLGQYEEALDYFAQALTIAQEIGSRVGEGVTLNNIGLVYQSLGRYDEALDYYEQSLAIRGEIGDRAGEGTTLNNIGGVYDNLGRHAEALDYYEQALVIYREVGDQYGEGTTLNNIGLVYDNLGRYAEALDYYEQSLTIKWEIGDQYGEGTTLNNIGDVYHSLGQYEEALDYLEQALAIQQKIGDRAGEGTTLDNIGGVYHGLGRYAEALDYYEQSLTIKQEIGDRAGEGITLNNIGAAYDSLGQYEGALGYYQQALAIWREIGHRDGEGRTLNNIGIIHERLGRYAEALGYYQQALAIKSEIGDRAGEGVTLNTIGAFYHRQERYAEALDYCQQALIIQREIGDRAGEGATLNSIGRVYNSLGRYEEALDYYEQSLSTKQGIGDRDGEAATLNNIGAVYHSLGRHEEALDYYQQALTIAQEVGDRAGESGALNNIGLVYKSLERYEEALDYYEQAIAMVETIHREMRVEELKSGFAAQQAPLYDEIIDLLDRMERPAEAFDYVQRAKARTLLDQLGNVRVNPLSTGDARPVEEEETLRGEIGTLNAQLREEWAKPPEQRSEEAIRALTARLEEKRDSYEELLLRLKLENPEYASLVSINTLTCADTQAMLGGNTTLVEYYVLSERILAFVVTEDDFHAVSISVTQDSLAENTQALYAFPSLEGVPPVLQTLYQDLIAPVEPYIHTDLVVIAPHRVLHYVPFAALHDGEHYSVEKHMLFYIPSASVLPFALEKRKPTVAPPLVLGDPDGSLPHARQEAQAIAGLYGVTAHVGEKAQEQLLWEQGLEAGILHLSTHGFYDVHSPLFSHLLLTPGGGEDGRLDVYEVYNRGLDLENADLVVLSACQTNLGEMNRGDEIVGLNRALIYAGAPSVMASLWSVDDASTRELMERFYTHLQEGTSKAGALRAAQMELIAEGKYAHPYYWAAFGVTGDPGEGEYTPPGLEATPEDRSQCCNVCPAMVLPLALVVLIGAKRRERERPNS